MIVRVVLGSNGTIPATWTAPSEPLDLVVSASSHSDMHPTGCLHRPGGTCDAYGLLSAPTLALAQLHARSAGRRYTSIAVIPGKVLALPQCAQGASAHSSPSSCVRIARSIVPTTAPHSLQTSFHRLSPISVTMRAAVNTGGDFTGNYGSCVEGLCIHPFRVSLWFRR
jgi:hypothetical protein